VTRPSPTARSWEPLYLAALIVVAVNLRPAVTSVGAVVDAIRTDYGLSAVQAGMLTTLPAVAFSVVALAGPPAARRLGPERAITVACALLAAGLALRVYPVAAALFVGSAVACCGIALANVLLPSVVKRQRSLTEGTATGIYTMGSFCGAAAGAALTVPLAAALGSWQWGLGAWSLLALAALPLWYRFASRDVLPDGDAPAAPVLRRDLYRDPVAITVTLFFGLQAMGAYALFGWLPSIYRGAGLTAEEAGALLGVMIVVCAPVSLIVPMLASRTRRQWGWVVLTTMASAAGYLGLLVWPADLALAWAVLLGIGNATFPLALLMFALRSRDGMQAAALSSMAQSLGYAIAAFGPIAVGTLHEWSGGWRAPLLLLLLVQPVQAGVGVLAARHRYVLDGPPVWRRSS